MNKAKKALYKWLQINREAEHNLKNTMRTFKAKTEYEYVPSKELDQKLTIAGIAWASVFLGLLLAILMLWGFIELGKNTTEMLKAGLIN